MRHLRRSLTRAAVTVGVALLAACSGATGPSEPSFTFFTQAVFGFPSRAPGVEIVDGDVLLTGILNAPTTTYTILGDLVRPIPSSLNITVRANKSGDGPPALAQHYYAAAVKNLPSGRYNVQLTYIIQREATDSSVVLQQSVTVP